MNRNALVQFEITNQLIPSFIEFGDRFWPILNLILCIKKPNYALSLIEVIFVFYWVAYE